MTSDRLAGVVLADEILTACDRVLGEVGRRRHMFGWLRLPGGATDQWLVMDAYYPGNRVVVTAAGSHDALLDDAVPAHGLRLLIVDPDELADDRAGLDAVLRRLLADLPEVMRPTGALPGSEGPRESPVARALVTMTQPDRIKPARPHGRRRASYPSDQAVAAGFVVGVALLVVLGAEFYIGLAEVALGTGHVLLAFGIALDACTRVLGMVAAERAGQRAWVLPCVIGGSPVVATFALFQRSGPVSVDPAPLAGLMSIISMAIIGLALLTMLLGI